MKPTLVTLLCAPAGNKLRATLLGTEIELVSRSAAQRLVRIHRGREVFAVRVKASRPQVMAAIGPEPAKAAAGRRPKHAYDTLTLEDWATKSNAEIAKLIGKSRTAVQIYRCRYGLPPSPIGKGRTARPLSESNVFVVLTDYRGLPLSRDDLVAETGLSREGVKYQLEQLLRAGLVISRPNPDWPSSMLYAVRVEEEAAA